MSMDLDNKPNNCYNENLKTAYTNKACETCKNNPKNGGDGICHCTLGLPEIKC